MCNSTIKSDPFGLGQISPVKRSVSTPTATDRHTLKRTATLAAILGSTDPLPGRAASARFPAGRQRQIWRGAAAAIRFCCALRRRRSGGGVVVAAAAAREDAVAPWTTRTESDEDPFRQRHLTAIALPSASSVKKALIATRYLICWQQKLLLGEAWWCACPVCGAAAARSAT